jgi:hypothetical protein
MFEFCGTDNVYLPFISVVIPIVDPFIWTVQPIIGCPSSDPVTIPVMLLCCPAAITRGKQKNIINKRILLIVVRLG